MVKEIDASGEILALYHPSDSFDTQALFEQSYRHSFIAVEQSLLYAMPKTITRTLIEENSEFGAYFFANIADKLKNQSDNRRENELAGLFTAKVHDAYRSYDEFGNFYGCQSISGDETLLKEVRTHLNGYLDSDVGMLMSFARAVNQFDEDGRGFFAQILGQKKHKMDIKKMGIFPVVHGTRALALKAKISKTNTFERIARLSQMGLIEQQLSQDVSEALAYLMNTRLKNGLLVLKHNQELAPNHIDTENLSTLERDLLKDALQVVKRFKHHVSSQFNLHYA